jgi:hypothetical protein
MARLPSSAEEARYRPATPALSIQAPGLLLKLKWVICITDNCSGWNDAICEGQWADVEALDGAPPR